MNLNLCIWHIDCWNMMDLSRQKFKYENNEKELKVPKITKYWMIPDPFMTRVRDNKEWSVFSSNIAWDKEFKDPVVSSVGS